MSASAGSPRLLAIHIPLFPLAARLRSEPELLEEAVAVFQGNGSAARLIAATRLARRSGLRPGMNLSQARALLPKLHVRPRDQECERAAQEAILEVAQSYSPRVEDAEEGTLYLDIRGLDRHFSPKGQAHSGENTSKKTEYLEEAERSLARDLLARADREAGMPAWVGIASSKLGARIAAQQPPTPQIIAPNREALFLAPMPLSRLSPEAVVYETLHRWGIRTIGDFAALPANEVSGRLGSLGHKLHEQARGIDVQPLVPYHPPDVFHEGMDLDWPLVSLEPFLFVARAALDRLCKRLDSAGFACLRLDLSLRLEPDGFSDRSILLPAPSRDVKTLLTLIRLNLEQDAPGAPVVGFTFLAHPDRPRAAQQSLFGPTALSPDKLATSLARLFSLLGPDGIGSPRPTDSHLPARFEVVDFRPPAPPAVRPETPRARGLLAIRKLDPPLRLKVHLESGKPLAVRTDAPPRPSDRKNSRPQKPSGRVRIASGPWTAEEGWWTEHGAICRDYWDIELEQGGIYRIFRNTRNDSWFADGVYD